MDGVSSVSWQFHRSTTTWLRVVSYVVFGAFGGLLVAGLLARFRLLQGGQYPQALILVVAALVGPVVFLVGLRYARRQGGRTRNAADGDPEFQWRWVGVAALLEGVVAYALISADGTFGTAAIAGLFLLAFGGAFALNVLSTAGSIDPDTRTLRIARPGGRIDLETVRNARTLRIGPVALAWLSYEPDTYGVANPDTRRLVVVSRDGATVLEATAGRNDGT